MTGKLERGGPSPVRLLYRDSQGDRHEISGAAPTAVIEDDREVTVMVTAGLDRGHVTKARLYKQTDGTLIACEVDPRRPPMVPPAPDEVLPDPGGS